MSLRAGDTVEHFVIVSPLGEGGMGQVYLARDTVLNRSLALKIVQPDPAGDSGGPGAGPGTASSAARLLREAQAAAALEHPNVVTIYEVGEIRSEGEAAGRPFIAMELVRGKALREFVGDASVPTRERIRWLVDVARALGAAHRAGLLHRDIKPENVMVRDDGVVKVLDFGLAKRAATASMSLSSSTEAQVLPSLTGQGVAVGTPYYMAPEQMRRETLDGRADQFSWGVVAYELLSGAPTWGRDVDALELVSKLLSEDPRPLPDVAPDVPPNVAAAVMRALSKRKGARFATMEDLVAALQDSSGALDPTLPRIAVGDAISPRASSVGDAAVPPGAAPRARTTVSVRPPRPSRARTILIAAAVVTAVAGAGVAAWRRQVSTSPTSSASPVPVPPVAPPECTRSTECVAKLGGKAAVCNPAGKCAAVDSEDCKGLFEPEDLRSDGTVWLGTMFSLHGPSARMGQCATDSIDLARRDFAQAFASLPEASRDQARRIGVVACDDTQDTSRAAAHLLDVGVPAVIGFRDTNVTIDLATGTFVPAGVLTLSAISLSPLLASIPHAPTQPRLVWRTSYNANDTARVLALLVARLEKTLRASGAIPPGGEMRVAIVRPRTRGYNALAETLFGALSYNGKSALQNGDAYREFARDGEGQDESQTAAIVGFSPHVVLVMSFRDVVPDIEARWPGGRGYRPYYLTNTPFDGDMLKFAGNSSERRRRLFGVSSITTTTENARLVLHFNETYSPPVTREESPNNTYDAFYVAGFALLASGAPRPTGEDLARSIAARLLPPGERIEVGPTGILPAYNALRRGAHLDLHGTTGHLAFDPTTGEPSLDLTVLCPAVDASGTAIGSAESGLVYDATMGQLVGTMHCR